MLLAAVAFPPSHSETCWTFVKIYSSCMHPWRVSEPMHGEITLTLFINAIQSVYKRLKSGEGPVLLLPLLHYSQSMYWIICQWQLQNKKLQDHLVFFAPSELVSINHHCFCLLDLYHTEQSLLIWLWGLSVNSECVGLHALWVHIQPACQLSHWRLPHNEMVAFWRKTNRDIVWPAAELFITLYVRSKMKRQPPWSDVPLLRLLKQSLNF